MIGLWLQPGWKSFRGLGGELGKITAGLLFFGFARGRIRYNSSSMSIQSDSIPDQISERLGNRNVEHRLELQKKLTMRKVSQGLGPFAMDHFFSLDQIIGTVIGVCGLKGLGLHNMMDLQIVENEVFLPGLPSAFEGFRLMQLSDLHCDLDIHLMEKVREMIQKIPHDAVVLTGDYHNKVSHSFERSLKEMKKLIPLLHPVRFGILGNHDFLEKTAIFEENGLPVLLNESCSISRGDQRLWICGIDDPHFFKTHDLVKARTGIPEGEISILLSHSPETYRQASELGYHLQLSGHTHGGQICLPGGIPIYHNAPGCRRDHLSGPWREKTMVGYTSRGTGSAGVAARFYCPPEITIHILRGVR